MHKKILIISSDYTGHGHKSITEALSEQLMNYDGVKFDVIDGFSLSGSIGIKIGKMYGPITRTSKDLWKLIWDISTKKPSILIDITESLIKDRLIRLINTVNPDAIIVTHPSYVSSVLNVMEAANIEIPLYPVVADPVTISPLWGDRRSHYTICPTNEAKEACMKMGVPEEKIKVFGFPVRQRFTAHLENNNEPADYDLSRPVKFTIMSGGEGSGSMSRIAKILVQNFNCRVRIICGKNKMLKKGLEYTLSDKYKSCVEILGFVTDIQNIMLDSDILFTRASPNTFMEAVMCNVPLIITGALPGQEEGNPEFVAKHNLGVVCNNIKGIKATVKELLDNGAEKLNKIKLSQRQFRDPYAAKKIVDFILHN